MGSLRTITTDTADADTKLKPRPDSYGPRQLPFVVPAGHVTVVVARGRGVARSLSPTPSIVSVIGWPLPGPALIGVSEVTFSGPCSADR